MNIKEFVHEVCRRLPGGKMLLCVSGGADSMALLHACVDGRVDCVAVHCDFHLRGDESERDREFVEAACQRLGVELHVEHFDVPAYMREHGVSVEMACRELRYALFRSLARELGCARIVVAHNSDDNDETMLLNLFRGTGITGLCGMSEDTGEIARPLLGVDRAQIETYMHEAGYKYIVDSSNRSTEYRRNFIRLELLPLIQSRWPGIRKSLARTRSNLQESRQVCDAAMQTFLHRGDSRLPAQVYEQAPSRRLLLMDWLSGRGASPTQIDEMAAGLRAGRRWQLPDCIVSMSAEGLSMIPVQTHTPTLPLLQTDVCKLDDNIRSDIRTNRGEEVLYHCGGDTLRVRLYREGDRISPLGMKGSRLVSDLLREAGVEPTLRAQVPVVVDSHDRLIWIPRIKRSRHMLIDLTSDAPVYRTSLIYVRQSEAE